MQKHEGIVLKPTTPTRSKFIFIIVVFSRIMPLALFRFRIYFWWTPWAEDRPDAMSLPTNRTAQHRKTRTHIHVSSRIRTHNPSVRAVEDITCLRQRGHWDRRETRNSESTSVVKNANGRLRVCPFPRLLK
jgi:hypothetical protein